MTIFDYYIKEQQEREIEFGQNTIVLMEVGMFYEIYGVNNNNEKLGRVQEISDLLNIQMSRKNKNIIENSRSNPLMAGVPNHSIKKYISILLNNNWTVVVMDQYVDPEGFKDIERRVREIYSPGTAIECNEQSDTNNLLSIYLESVEQMNNKELYVAGISIIDLSTGKNIIYQTNSGSDDTKFCLDELYRFINIHNPREIIINGKNLKITQEELVRYLEIDNKIYHINLNNHDNDIYKISYQNEFLNRIFKNIGLLTVIEYLDLERLTYGLYSYIYLLRFAHYHNEHIISRINKPIIWDNSKYLLLSHSSIYQLNLVSSENIDYNKTRYKSLFHVINKTNTIIGRRLLKERLLNPIINKNKLQKEYDYIEAISESYEEDYLFNKINTLLLDIRDIERLHRKISLGILPPCDYFSLDMSYSSIMNIIDIIKDNDKLNDLIPESVSQFNEYILEYRIFFDMIEICKYNFNNITNSFFNKGVNEEIDKIQEEINIIKSFFNDCIKSFSIIIDENVAKDKALKLEYTEQYGYYLSLTKKRSEKLKSYFNKHKEIKIGNNLINTKDINLNTKHSTVKLEFDLVTKYSQELVKLEENIKIIVHKFYLESIEQFYKKYSLCMQQIVQFVGKIDVISNNGKVANIYKYCKPKLAEDDNKFSFIEANDLRHPIIERMDNGTEYVPNDVTLGKDNQNGILLYGVNASGKSSLMKSVGLSLIMAQAGMYVPCSKFIYEPYHNLFTRISNNDNIFKGQSTFSVEMSELRSILKRADSQSLILGDELCTGTEWISGQSIVAAGIIFLSKKNTSFIFATHMHQLNEISEIKELENVKTYHLKVEYNYEQEKLIYNRKIESGVGSSIYGLEVCKAMDLEYDFLELANNIRHNYFESQTIINTPKTSHYNSNLYIDVCKICNQTADDVHHIKFQSDADKDGMIGFYHKNKIHNLVSLCKDCHNKIHKNLITVNGYIQTTNGLELDYVINDISTIKKTKKKYSSEQIEVIKELYNYPNMDVKKAIDILNKQHDLKVSKIAVTKIWNNTY